MNRAQLLKEHYRSQPDPRGEAREVGVAFAEAAAAAHREANRRLVGNVEGECPEDELVAHLEKEARDFCGWPAASPTSSRFSGERAPSACREIVRKRTFYAAGEDPRPSFGREEAPRARVRGGKKATTETTAVRPPRVATGFATPEGPPRTDDVLRDGARTSRAASSTTRELMTLFALNDDDDRTVSEDEDDYEAMITEFAGDPARGVTPALSEEDEERLNHEAKFVSKEVIDARVKAGLLFDRSHAKNQSTVAIDGLTISCRRERASAPPSVKSEGAVAATLATSSSLVTTPSQKRRVVEVSSIRSTKTPQKPPR